MSAPATFLLALLALGQGVPEVDPPDLARKPDLLNKEVLVDGRVALFQFHPGKGFDEILLKESDVILRLPVNLRFRQAPNQRVVRAQGTLKREGDRLFLDVRSLQLLPDDRERLQSGLASLPPGEITRRRAWAAWAARRGRIYKDDALSQIALQLESEVLWSEADRPESRSPDATLALARRGRDAKLPEPIPSALAHRAFRALRRDANSPDDLARLAARILDFFPDAKTPPPAAPPGYDDWAARYRESGEAAYRQAAPDLRAALDRLLLADVIQAELEARLAADPTSGLDLAARARSALPDRPALADTLRSRGLEASASDVTRLRRNEAFDLARNLEDAGRADQAATVRRNWLDHYRINRLAPGDADGRVNLAQDYLNIVKDRQAAIALLREAFTLDPSSRPASELFRRLGFQLRDGQWIEAATATARSADPGAAGEDDPLIGLTPDDVEARLGKPDRRSQVVTQGSVRIQWVYRAGQRGSQYINFMRRPGSPPTVIGRYSEP